MEMEEEGEEKNDEEARDDRRRVEAETEDGGHHQSRAPPRRNVKGPFMEAVDEAVAVGPSKPCHQEQPRGHLYRGAARVVCVVARCGGSQSPPICEGTAPREKTPE